MDRLLASSDGFFGWLWRASWQAALVVVLVLLAQRVFATRLTPRWRHALWFLVVIRLALPGSVESRISLFNFLNPARLAAFRDPSGNMVASAAPGSGAHSVPSGAAGRSRSHVGSWANLRSIWLTGVVALSVYLCAGAWRMRGRIRRQRPVTSEAVLSLLEDCKQEMGVFTPLALLETATIQSPALLGFVRPRLLLPEGLIRSFSLPELRYVFLHELGHLKRGDILLNWLLAVPLVLHWFNPVVWYAILRMRSDGEAACDAMALSRARDGENQPYGQTIIKLLERFSSPAKAPGLVGILENNAQMAQRIGMIAAFKKTNRWPVFAASLATSLALLTLTDARSQQPLGMAPEQSAPSQREAGWQPCVIASSPRAGEAKVHPELSELTMTFDRDMSEDISWTKRDNGPYFPPTPKGQQAYWRNRRTCVLPVKLEAGQYYRVELNRTDQQDCRGKDGRAAAQSVLFFATQGASEASSCISNLHQIGMAMNMYLSENADAFPYSEQESHRLSISDVWLMLNPYIGTNAAFFVCPTDSGPFNVLYVKLSGSLLSPPMTTNDLSVASSYYYYAGFYQCDPPRCTRERRRLSNVIHPSQKVVLHCEALSSSKEIRGLGFDGYAHAAAAKPFLFVDSHARFLPRRAQQSDPRIPLGFGRSDWSGLDWADFP